MITVRGSPPDHLGKNPLLLAVVLLRALHFLPTSTPARQRRTSNGKVITKNDNINKVGRKLWAPMA